MLKCVTFLLLCGIGQLAIADEVMPATGGSIDDTVEQIYLLVDPYYIPEEDEDPADIPHKTIQSAVRSATGYLEREIPVRIHILNGLYRESVTIPGGSFGALLVIEGQSRDGVVISGAEEYVEDWMEVGGEAGNIWMTAWNKDWGDFTRDQVWSASASPQSPQLLVSQSQPDSISLSWQPATKPKMEIVGYRVYRQKMGEEQSYAQVSPLLETTSWEDTTVNKATAFEDNNYGYYVTAVDKWDNESLPSGLVNSRARDPQDAGYLPYAVRRREAVYADGVPLRMVAEKAELASGTFFVDDGYLRDDEDGTLTICLPDGTTPENTEIEIATNLNLGRKYASACLYVVDKPNLYIRNLTVTHSVQDGIRLDSCRNVKIENVTAVDNGGTGIEINVDRKLQPYSENVTLRNIDASRNGKSGIGGSRFINLLIDNCTTNENNWRGAWGSYYDGDRAGMKLLNVHRGTIRSHTSTYNHTHGIWFDYNNRNILIENSTTHDNRMNGLYVEASQGPITIRNTISSDNFVGLYISNTRDGVLENCILANNRGTQIEVLNRLDRPVVDWQNGEEGIVNPEDWRWQQNIVVSDSLTTTLINAPYADWRFFYDTLTSSGNLWWSPYPDRAYKLDGQYVNLRGWQFASGQDTDSLFAEPQLIEESTGTLKLGEGSPIFDRSNWPVTELPEDRLELLEDQLLAAAENASNNPFPYTEDTNGATWRSLDLTAIANGAPGAPAFYELGSERVLQGVPITLVDVNQNAGLAEVRLGYFDEQKGVSENLPASITLPMASKAEAVYTLLSVVSARTYNEIGMLTFEYTDGTSASLPIVSLGVAIDEDDDLSLRASTANIQDWWRDYYQFDNEQTRKVQMLIDRTRVWEGMRYAYLVEWINPHPEKDLTSMTLTTDPLATPRLRLMAVSALVPDVSEN